MFAQRNRERAVPADGSARFVTPASVPPLPGKKREQLRITEKLGKLRNVLERYLGSIIPRGEMGLRKLSRPRPRRTRTAGKTGVEAMKLNATQVKRTLSQFDAEVLPKSHPAVPQLNTLFGDHTFFLDNDGLRLLAEQSAYRANTARARCVDSPDEVPDIRISPNRGSARKLFAQSRLCGIRSQRMTADSELCEPKPDVGYYSPSVPIA